MASTPTALTTRGNDKSRWRMIRLGAQTDARKFEQFRLYSVGDVPSSPGEGGTFLPPPRNKRGFRSIFRNFVSRSDTKRRES